MSKPILDLSQPETPRLEIEFNEQKSQDGILTSVRASGEAITNFLSAAVIENKHFGPAAAVESEVSSAVLAGLAQRNVDGIGGKAYQKDRDAELPKTDPSRRNLINAVRERNSALEVSKHTALDFSFVENQIPSALRSDLRRDFLSQDSPKRIPIALSSNLPLAISILEGGQSLAGLPDDVWASFEDHCMELLYVHRYAKDVAFRRQPSLDRITASGVDIEACRKAAREAIDARKAELEAVELAELYLQRQIGILAAVSGRDAKDFL